MDTLGGISSTVGGDAPSENFPSLGEPRSPSSATLGFAGNGGGGDGVRLGLLVSELGDDSSGEAFSISKNDTSLLEFRDDRGPCCRLGALGDESFESLGGEFDRGELDFD